MNSNEQKEINNNFTLYSKPNGYKNIHTSTVKKK